MEIGEPIASSVSEKKEQPEKVKKIKIRFSIFFDGTLNNRTNINQRLLAAKPSNLTKEEKQVAAELKKKHSYDDIVQAKSLYKQHGAKKLGEDNSYEGYYTNIVLMDKYIDPLPPEGYALNLKVYIEGCGSIDKATDQTSGFAFAIWKSGIPARVKKGLQKAVSRIEKNHSDVDVIIEKLTLDVFGFSRGAAIARSFIYAALFGQSGSGEPESLSAKLKEQGYTVNQVEVCFAGLYDTVSTYGVLKTITRLGASNTRSLKLDAIVHAQKVVQIASADEHRQYFSLTNIKSARGKGKEIFLPGVHSDIGGGYRDNASEQLLIYEDFGYSYPNAEKDRQHWLEVGWYRPDEITLEYKEGYEGDESDDGSWIRVVKKDISNQYSRIPLHLMAGYARENKVPLKSRLERDQDIPETLMAAKQEIEQYIARTPVSRAEHWLKNNAPWLKQLRHDYLHFSARIKTGHSPRFINGKRGRVVLEG